LKIDHEYEDEDAWRQRAVPVYLILERQSGHASLIGVKAKTEEHDNILDQTSPL
jgi:hypothetical protein